MHAGVAKITNTKTNRPSWVPVGKMVTYDQYVTIQISTELSPALDAVDDLTHHLVSDARMLEESFTNASDPVREVDPAKLRSLKSPRGHPKFGMGSGEVWKRIKKFPVIDFATVDHTIDIAARRARWCQAMAQQAMELLGPVIEAGDAPRKARNALDSTVNWGLSMITGLFGVGLFGLGGQVAQLNTKVNGLESSIPSLRLKT